MSAQTMKLKSDFNHKKNNKEFNVIDKINKIIIKLEKLEKAKESIIFYKYELLKKKNMTFLTAFLLFCIFAINRNTRNSFIVNFVFKNFTCYCLEESIKTLPCHCTNFKEL